MTPTTSPPARAPGAAAARAGAAPPGVLFVVPKFPPPVVGGLERQAYELAGALAGAGTPVQVLSGRVFPGQRSEVRDGVRVLRLPDAPGWLKPLAQGAAMAWWMVVLRRRYRVVHLHNLSWFGFPALLLARLLRRPVLAKLPSLGRVGGVQMQLERPLGRLWLRAFLRADAVVALVPENLEEMRVLGYPAERVFPMTNGVSTQGFRPAEGARRSDGPPRAVFVGRLSPEKGLPDLLSVWAEVQRRAPGARLEVYGDGPEAGAIRAQLASLGLEDSVTLHGATQDVRAAYQSADAFVLPSYSEGNSNSMLEAMACGLPVVAFRVGGAAMMVGPDGADWLADPRDPDGLAQRLGTLLASPDLRRSVGDAMLRRVRAHFDVHAVAAAYRRAYECLAAGESTRMRSLASPLFSR